MDSDALDAFFAHARRGEAQDVINKIAAQPKLLKEKDSVNGWTVLHFLSRLSLATPVQQILSLGADPEARDSIFRSPLHLAASADASLPSSMVTEDHDRTAAMLTTMRALLKGGARVTARDSFGMTALHHAARAGQDDAVLLLLSLNTEMRLPRAPLEAETNAEERPLHLAAAGGHATTVQLLLKHGAHPGKTNYLGQTALHLAAAAGDAPSVLAAAAELVKPDWRADLSVGSSDGSTPLHLAAAGGHTKMVRVLLKARNVKRNGGGRSVELTPLDSRGRTPADRARAEGFDDVVAMLDNAVREAAERLARAPAEQEAALRQAFAQTRLTAGGRASGARSSGAATRGSGMGALDEADGEELEEEAGMDATD
jgi:ankyrin repeat protein